MRHHIQFSKCINKSHLPFQNGIIYKLTLSYCDGEAENYLTASGRDTTVYLHSNSVTFNYTVTAADGKYHDLDFLLGGVNLTHLEIQKLCTTLHTMHTANTYWYEGKEGGSKVRV